MDNTERQLEELRLLEALNTLAAAGTFSCSSDTFNRWKEWQRAILASGYAVASEAHTPMSVKLRIDGLEILRPHRDMAALLGCKLPQERAG